MAEAAEAVEAAEAAELRRMAARERCVKRYMIGRGMDRGREEREVCKRVRRLLPCVCGVRRLLPGAAGVVWYAKEEREV